jgi:OOP family OmpA-OmpF porin
MMTNRLGLLAGVAVLAVMGTTGCATKKYVRTQNAPLIDHEKQLDQQSAANQSKIQEVDERSQTGIRQAQGSADAAGRAAGDAQNTANQAVHRLDSLESVIRGLDDYKEVGNVSVNFPFDGSVLSREDKAQLDTFAAQLASARGYILEVTGGTDATGSDRYNYQLSQRRADAVVAYLVVKYGIPPHRFYLVGIGRDKAVADNKTRDGRKQNRRVTVQLLTNAALAGSSGK